MNPYKVPTIVAPEPVAANEIVLIASGDSRESANQLCWPAQQEMEQKIGAAFAGLGYTVRRANDIDPKTGHGFIQSQRMGMEVFQSIHPEAKLIVAEAVWQYSHHVLAGLQHHRGPILTLANWSGQWPGLVGLLNLNGSLTKMEVEYSTLWSQNFDDEFFMNGIREWAATGMIKHDYSHVHEWFPGPGFLHEIELGKALADQLLSEKAILGVFDEGCMGMANAILDDCLLNRLGIFKERLSQSALLANMRLVTDSEARAVYDWLLQRGMKFVFGTNPATELLESQTLEQCKMYVAAVRMAAQHCCDAIGIQYQLGLADSCAASDLAEGLLNNPDRPPVYCRETGAELFAGEAMPHFNEVDEGAGVDALVTNRVWTAMGMDPSTTLHDVRYGEDYQGQFVWVFLISGAAPASHFIDGYAGAVSERQPPMYFAHGGGSLKGISKPGEIVWSRIYTASGEICADLGRATVVELPNEETERRWQMTTPAWPIMHAVLHGVSRDQMMARHKANHLNVVYATDSETADKAFAAKASMLRELGIRVFACGV